MSFLDTLGQALGQGIAAPLNSQIAAAEQETQIIGQAVAVWGVIVTVELGIVIFLLARKSK